MVPSRYQSRHFGSVLPHPFHGPVQHYPVPGLGVLIESHRVVKTACYESQVVSARKLNLVFGRGFPYRGAPPCRIKLISVSFEVKSFPVRKLHGIEVPEKPGKFGYVVKGFLLSAAVKFFSYRLFKFFHFPEKTDQIYRLVYAYVPCEFYEVRVIRGIHAMFFGKVGQIRVEIALRYFVLLERNGSHDKVLKRRLVHFRA